MEGEGRAEEPVLTSSTAAWAGEQRALGGIAVPAAEWELGHRHWALPKVTLEPAARLSLETQESSAGVRIGKKCWSVLVAFVAVIIGRSLEAIGSSSAGHCSRTQSMEHGDPTEGAPSSSPIACMEHSH